MALTVNQQHQSNLKHFCKICKKSFGCGRALGGHMRAHGIGDASWNLDDDEDAASDWEEKQGGSGPPSMKRMYTLRTNPNRLKSCRVCENCGKEFLSWKSFLEHGKCTSDDVESSPVSSPMSDGEYDGEDVVGGQRGCRWSKRKRSFRPKFGTLNSICPSSEEEDLANCLMMLSNAIVGPLAAATDPEESSASASRDEERRNPINFITPVSYCVPPVDNHKAKSVVPKGLFECKACKKIFNSHQALGGHRASHKKVKGCFASRLDHLEDKDDDVITHEEFLPIKSNSTVHDHPSNNNATLLMASSSSKRKSKVHECSICHRTFSSGQALGGHKRCHWITPNAPASSTLARFQQFQDHMERLNQIPKFDNSEPLDLKLDLNLPAPAGDPARRDLSTEIFLQPWLGGTTTKEKDKINNSNSQCHSPSNRELQHHQHQHHYETENDNEEEKINNDSNVSMENVEDEADSKVKLAKLSELKDMNIGGSSSPWLQVGIGSTTGVGAEPQ
ncbi:zinc finger protein ZAT4-like [Prosopis cineraria]|uniref:zinc finger protein ZAT4-like n=1 Tax=Prosopis cineraria TaxID=364024 RepID=UPI00241079A0|nr:zinc finger protein ZAT4-like [Prosopis cineraria]